MIWAWPLFIRHRRPLWAAIEPLLFPFDMEAPVLIHVARELRRPQLQDRLGPGNLPGHPRALHAGLHQVLARALDGTRRYRQPYRQIGFFSCGVSPKRAPTTSSGVRTHGCCVNTAATVAIFFLLAFSPFFRRAVRFARAGFTSGTPLQSTADTSMGPVSSDGRAFPCS